MGTNYFNSLPLRVQLEELSKCRFMQAEEFAEGVDYIRGKKLSSLAVVLKASTRA